MSADIHEKGERIFDVKKLLFISAVLLFILSGCSEDILNNILGDSDSNSNDNRVDVTVDYVVDGDTVDVIMPDDSEESVRFLLIDTPESVHPDKPQQPYGQEASEFVSDLLVEGQTIQLEYDGPKRDKYDRLLAYIWVDDKNVNEMLLKKGLARYAYEYDPPYKYQEKFKEAEQKAEEENLNIWSIDGYVESEFETW